LWYLNLHLELGRHSLTGLSPLPTGKGVCRLPSLLAFSSGADLNVDEKFLQKSEVVAVSSSSPLPEIYLDI
jgi:hypothetical protein